MNPAVAPASVLAERASGSGLGAERLSGRIESLQSLLPRLRASQVASPRPLEEIGSSLRGRHVVLYFRAREDLWQIVVRSGAPEIRRLEIEVAEAGRWAGRLAADPGDPVALGVLSRALLPPSSLPAPGAELLVAADPTLDGIPFALLEVRGQPLVTRNPVLHVPSLNALVVLAQRARDSTAAPVVLGDPRGDRPAARREVLEVAARLGSEPRVGSAADRTALDGARRARVLHLATHAGSGAGGPWLALADGELEAAEVLERQLAPELVVSPAARRRRVAASAPGAPWERPSWLPAAAMCWLLWGRSKTRRLAASGCVSMPTAVPRIRCVGSRGRSERPSPKVSRRQNGRLS